jgi:hypothetical protein
MRGAWREGSFPRAFERRENFLYLGKFYEKFEKGPVNKQLSPYGPCWVIWTGSFIGFLGRKRKCISGFLCLGPRGY